MSDTNRVGVAIRRVTGQSSFPATLGGPLTNLRITGAPSLAFTPQTIVSDEIRPDRQRSDLIPVGAEAGGEVTFEYSYGSVDELIESALFSTWDNTLEKTPDSGAMGAGTIPFADPTGFVVGQLVQLQDPSVSPTGYGDTIGVYEVTVVGMTDITVVPYDINSLDSTQTNAPAISASFESDAQTVVKVVGVLGAAGDISFDAAGIASAAGIFDDNLRKDTGTTNIVPGHFIRIIGSDAAVASTNDVWIQVIGVRAAGAGLDLNVPAAWQTDPGTGDTVAIFFGDVVRNGAEDLANHQFIVEESFNDHTPVSYVGFLEMAVNTLNMTLDPQAIAQGSVNFFGTDALASTTESDLYSDAPATRNDSPQNNVYNTSSNVARLGQGAEVVGSGGVNCVLQATVDLNNNLRRNNAVGVFGACAIGVGELAVSGNLSTYFDDLTLFNDLLSGAETSVDFGLRSLDGKVLLTDLPRIKYNGGAPQVPGKNQDVVLPLTYDALLDADLGYTISFQRFDYAA